MKPAIRIDFVNMFPGFSQSLCRSHVLMDLCDEFDFVFDTKSPEILLIGCYSQQPVEPGGAIAVGYYTENIAPDLQNCDYFFGCEYSPLIGHPRYCKRVFGPMSVMTFGGCDDPEAELATKTDFCNFIYTSRVGHRERVFRALSAYKPVRAPGGSMNNCRDLTAGRQSADWQAAKLAYLSRFKFTIAFENSRRPGYVSEKLFDAFAADTVPIYWGDPAIATVINPASIVQVAGDWEAEVLGWLKLPEKREPFRPYKRVATPLNKLAGRVNDLATRLRHKWPYSKGFTEAIEEIRWLDNDDQAFCRKLAEPRAKREAIEEIRADYFAFWRKIIERALERRERTGERDQQARQGARL